MYGVVLWSDEQEHKAVIWCEDHGDLAFYRKSDGDDQVALDAGDWVQFDMTMDRHLRFARNPRLVHDGVYPDLADALSAATPALPTPSRSIRSSATIIPFAHVQAARRPQSDDAREMYLA